ncbi:MAG: hypothetical protein M2R45_02344 [Verrucomicrobia subdivision 3 bacterium]|nr:hypothetical protein [Limisphaerales bacterium]MCS1414896.1 hypothetical protein [Limisphaerales bacterium]
MLGSLHIAMTNGNHRPNAASPSTPKEKTQTRAFTLIELLVVIATIAILAAILLPAHSRPKNRGEGALCLNNTKELLLAWLIYASDNNGKLVGNPGAVPITNTNRSWCVAGQQPGGVGYQQGYETNTVLFMHGLLGPYVRTRPYVRAPKIFRCPADKFIFPGARGPFARSYAMNNWMNGYVLGTTEAILYTREAQMRSPSNLFVFIHEDPNTIDDGTIAIDLSRSTTNSWNNSNTAAALHNGSTNIGFADGRAELHRWQSTMKSTGKIKTVITVNTMVRPNIDANWLKKRTSEHR